MKQKGSSKMPVNTPNTSSMPNVQAFGTLPPITCAIHTHQGPKGSNHDRVSARLTQQEATRKHKELRRQRSVRARMVWKGCT